MDPIDFERETVRRKLQESLNAVDEASSISGSQEDQRSADLIAAMHLALLGKPVTEYLTKVTELVRAQE